VLTRFRVKATDFTRQRVLSWQVVVVMRLRGHKVSLQTAVNKFFSALGTVWQVVTASAYSQARQKVQPEVFVHLNAVVCEEYYTRYGEEGAVALWHGQRLILIQASLAANGSARMAVSRQSILQGGYLDEFLHAAT
jgi:hypothetical protein